MLRGHQRYEFVASVAQYHQIANPLILPIAGATFRTPRSIDIKQELEHNLGPLLHGLHPVVPDNGWHNTVAAFRKRCNYHNAGRATPFIIHSAMEFVKVVCPQPLKPFEWSEQLYREWREKFDTEKQRRMDEALRTLPNAKLGDYSMKDIFVKIEALLVGHKPNWAPRVIFKGTDLYNAVSGPIFNELMRRFDCCLNRMEGDWQFRTSYKKTPDEYVPFVERREEGEYWVEADFSSNDKFQCSDVQLLEVAMMRVLGCPEWFVRLHLKTNKFQVKNAKHGIKATLENQLPTGATDTTFRNTFWNGCILWSVLTKLKIRSCRALLMGDDMLACMRGESHYLAKVYTSVATEAMMEAKVFRHACLYQASFLSKSFLPSRFGCHMVLPLMGKALGRFNARANKNSQVTDEGYMLGKAIGYAYEFRYYPTLRDIFLKRTTMEAPFVKSQSQVGSEITWNARTAGVTLRNIASKINDHAKHGITLSDDDFTAFCWERYNCLGTEVVELFEQVVLNRMVQLDVAGIVCEKLAKDFL